MTREFKFKSDWLLWFLILLPTFYLVGKDMRHVQTNFFQLAVIVMLAFYHVNKYIGAFLIFAVFQFVYFPDSANSAVLLQNLFFGALLYHFIVNYADDMKKYYWVLFGILALNLVWCVFQIYGIDPIFKMADYGLQQKITEPSAFFSLPAFLGNYAAAIAPLMLVINPWLILFVPIALYFSKSTFSVLAAVVGILFYLWFKKRILFWIVGGILIVGTSFYAIKFDAPTGQFGKRFKIWQLSLEEGFKKQFFGHGIGSYGTHHQFFEMEPSGNVARVQKKRDLAYLIVSEPRLLKNKELVSDISKINPDDFDVNSVRRKLMVNGINFKEWNQPHNEFVRVFFDMGLFGVLIVCAYFFNLFKRFSESRKKLNLIALASATLAILVVSFGHFPFYLARIGCIYVVILAFFELELMRAENA